MNEEKTSNGHRPLLAVNYSRPARDLKRSGFEAIDMFKCVAWPDLVEEALKEGPAMVHFPLAVGKGTGDAIDSESGKAPDWGKIERMLKQTETRFINVHLGSPSAVCPQSDGIQDESALREMSLDCLGRDLEKVVERFGSGMVIAENGYDLHNRYLRACSRPDVIFRTIENFGCGFLLDLGHAHIAARDLDQSVHDYLDLLPLERIHEMHITGTRDASYNPFAALGGRGMTAEHLDELARTVFDHLPLNDGDWLLMAEVAGRLGRPGWGKPWLVTFEYGGVGSFWEAIVEPEILEKQLGQLSEIVSRIGS